MKYYLLLPFLLTFFTFFSSSKSLQNFCRTQLNTYYFDGWTGTYPHHITATLRDSFPEREPK